MRPDAPWPAAQLRRADQTRAAHLKTGGFLAGRGQALGFVRHTQYADLYNPKKVVLFGGMLPEFRRQGVRQRLLATLEQHLPSLGVFQPQTEVSVANSTTLAFLRRVGFEEMWRRLPYRLEVDTTLEAFLESLTRKLEHLGVHVETYPQLAEDAARDEKLRALSWQLEQDVLYGEPPVELDLEAFRRERLAPAAVLKDAFYVAVRGERYFSMSSLWNYGAYLETEFTGVLPEYRGQGVAALTKLLGVRYAQRRGFSEVRTTNNAGNDAMRRPNEQLGFVAQPALLRLENQLTQSAMLRP